MAAMLNISFDKYYMISKLRFMPLSEIPNRTFKDGVVSFEGGEQKQVI